MSSTFRIKDLFISKELLSWRSTLLQAKKVAIKSS